MKAIIIQTLVKPTRFGHSVIKYRIVSKKNQIFDDVNTYILNRANQSNFIKVSNFEVFIYDYKGRLVDNWNYKPTYKDDHFDDDDDYLIDDLLDDANDHYNHIV